MSTPSLDRTKRSIVALVAAALMAIPLGFAAGEPENVSGLSATAVNESSIGLSWNSAKDANEGLVLHYRLYYGTTSVQQAGEGEYDEEADTPNNNTSYVVSGLDAGTEYFFSITAVDNNGVESEAYSLEASATTLGGAMEEEASEEEELPEPELFEEGTEELLNEEDAEEGEDPAVDEVTVLDNTHVNLTFSEAITLPDEMPESAFNIVDQLSGDALEVLSAVKAGPNLVTLETESQTPDTTYVVTVGVNVKDSDGNSIVSGSMDSGAFDGSDLGMDDDSKVEEVEVEEMAEEEAEEDSAEESAVASCGADMDCFYENLKTCSPATSETSDDAKDMAISSEANENNECVLSYEVTLAADPLNVQTMTCTLPTNTLASRAIAGQKGDGLFADKADAEEYCSGDYLVAFAAELPSGIVQDVTPPENVTNLILSFRENLEKFVVTLKWTASLNSAKDLVDQIVYMSTDLGKNYDAGTSLGAVKTSHEENNLEGGKEYTFKVTTKDAAGNESVGAVKSIRLPETGAAAGLLLIGSALGARGVLRRKRQ